MKWSMKRTRTIVVDNGEVKQNGFFSLFSRNSKNHSSRQYSAFSDTAA